MARPAKDVSTIAEAVGERLRQDRVVRRTLPDGGRLHIDRQLPFLCLYRRPRTGKDLGTESLVTGTAAYLSSSLDPENRKFLTKLANSVVKVQAESFGAFLLVQIVSGSPGSNGGGFRVSTTARDPGAARLAREIRTELRRAAKELELTTEVVTKKVSWKSLDPPISPSVARDAGCRVVEIEVPTDFRDPETGKPYPQVLRAYRRVIGLMLQRIFHRFSCKYTTRCPVNYQMLGRRAVVKAVWTVDGILAEVSESFDFLLQITPENSAEAWEEFQRSKFERTPSFRYRAIPVDPVLLKRRIWSAPVERIEDPTLFDLLGQVQQELDREVTLLLDRESPRFLLGTTQIYGGVGEDLLALARTILDRCPVVPGDDTSGGVSAESFATQAEAEIAGYREQWEGFDARVEVRKDIARGILVSRGALLIGSGTRIPAARVEALLHHEVGTHLLTYFNGRQQRLHLLSTGLAGYDPFQEGIAVLSEYLIGGLTTARLRLLAARVVSVHQILAGGTFIDGFRSLTRDYGFDPRTAFTMTMRVFRGGGLTKDAAYLRGLQQVLEYLHAGGALEPLWIGKIASNHVPVILELRFREVLDPPRLRPRYLENAEAQRRLERVRAGATILDILDEANDSRP